MFETIDIASGALRATIVPACGGALAGLWHGGTAVLRPAPDPARMTSPREGACFALVPYSNRLGHRRFRWHGQAFEVQPNFDAATPHALHGVGWRRAWRVASSTSSCVDLALLHRADVDWPFAFEATQRLELRGDTLTMHLAVRNTDARTQPVGLGWHPYFTRRAGARLSATVRTRSEKGADALPTHEAAHAPFDAARIDALDVDHGYAGWDGAATIDDDAFAIELRASVDRLVVFTPPGREFFCVEPVTHATNALNAADPCAHGVIALAPDQAMTATATLQVTRKFADL